MNNFAESEKEKPRHSFSELLVSNADLIMDISQDKVDEMRNKDDGVDGEGEVLITKKIQKRHLKDTGKERERERIIRLEHEKERDLKMTIERREKAGIGKEKEKPRANKSKEMSGIQTTRETVKSPSMLSNSPITMRIDKEDSLYASRELEKIKKRVEDERSRKEERLRMEKEKEQKLKDLLKRKYDKEKKEREMVRLVLIL